MYSVARTQAARIALTMVPVTLLVLLISPVWLVALALPDARRAYALKLLDAATAFVRALNL